MTATRAQLRRRIGRLVGDVVVLTATAGGSTTTVVDTVNGVHPDGVLKGRRLYVASASASGNVGLSRVVSTNALSTGTVTFSPALPGATASGDVVELWNERGVGLKPDEIHDAIDRAIDAVAHVTLEPAVSSAAAFDRESPTVAIPAGWSHYSLAEWEDDEGVWHPVPAADVRRDLAARTVELRNRSRWLADGKDVRLRGWTPAGPLASDAAETGVDAEWLTYHAASEALMGAAHRAHATGEALAKAQWFRDKADSLRAKTRTRTPAGPLHRLP